MKMKGPIEAVKSPKRKSQKSRPGNAQKIKLEAGDQIEARKTQSERFVRAVEIEKCVSGMPWLVPGQVSLACRLTWTRYPPRSTRRLSMPVPRPDNLRGHSCIPRSALSNGNLPPRRLRGASLPYAHLAIDRQRGVSNSCCKSLQSSIDEQPSSNAVFKRSRAETWEGKSSPARAHSALFSSSPRSLT